MELAILFAGVAAIAAIAATLITNARRQERFERFAAQHELEIVDPGRDTARYLGWVTDVPGSSHKWKRVVAGPKRDVAGESPLPVDASLAGRDLFGEFTYETGGSEDSSTERVGLFFRPLPANFPETTIAPEGLLPRLGDIKTEWGDFNRRFYVVSASTEFAIKLLYTRLQEYLMENVGGERIDLIGGGLVIRAPNFEESDYFRLREMADGISQRIQPFLLKDYG